MSKQDDKLYCVLKDIEINQAKVCIKLDNLLNQQTKIIFALIAIIGATIGLKFVGSPLYVLIVVYVDLFVFIFVTLFALWKYDKLKGWIFILLFGLCGVIGNLIGVLPIGMHPPLWVTWSLFPIGNTAILLFLWRYVKDDREKIRQKTLDILEKYGAT